MSEVNIGNISIPMLKGDKGDAGKITSITITMLDSTATAYVTNTGTQSEAIMNLFIPKGVGISSAAVTSGNLSITLDNGTVLDCGRVVGTSISSVTITEDYDLVITLSDGTETVAGNIEDLLSDILDDYYTKTVADGKFALITETGNKIDLSVNSSTYVVTATLKDKNNNTLSTATIDLPLESVVVSGSYDATNKKIILTLQSGSTIEFSVADLVSGLQTEITSSNKLSADLVTDTNTTNKFVTSTEKTKISNAITATDYASSSTGGTIIAVSSYGLAVGSGNEAGKLRGSQKDYATYSSGSTSNNLIVCKGTLENVITGKGLTTKSYVDGLVGDIADAIDLIQGEVI